MDQTKVFIEALLFTSLLVYCDGSAYMDLAISQAGDTVVPGHCSFLDQGGEYFILCGTQILKTRVAFPRKVASNS